MSSHDPSARDNEPARDAWLSEALRHAPDANAAPPLALSEAILRQARAATRPPIAVPRANPLMAAWSWLARPPIAAGFASVMVATVIGLMWWDRPLDEALQRPPAPSAARVDAAAPPVASADARLRAAAPAPAPALEPAPSPAPATVPAPPRSPAAAARTAKAAAPAPSPTTSPTTEPSAGPPSAAPTPAQAPARDEAESKTQARAAAPEAPLAERSSPALAPAPAPAPAPAFARAPAPASLAESIRSTPDARAAADSRAASFDALVAAIGDEPARWTWQRSAGTLPPTQSLRHWLGQSAVATAGRWRPAPDALPAGRSLRLFRDGTLAATLALDDTSLWYAPASGSASRAALAPEAASTLRRALDLAAP